jgi:ankyrin repeat protein
MKKTTPTFNTLILTLLFSTFSMHSMKRDEEEFTKLLRRFAFSYNQSAYYKEKSQAQAIFHNKEIPLFSLPQDIFNPIFAYCHEQDNDPVQAIKKSLKNFMTLRCVCKNFNALLLDKTIGNLCNHYTQDSKDAALKNVLKIIYFVNFDTIRTPGLLLVYAGADPNVRDFNGSSLLGKAVTYNDKELIRILFEYHADPNVKDCQYNPLFFDITSVDMLRLFISHKDFNIFATDILGFNALWRAIGNEYPSEILDLYLKHNLDTKQFRSWKNDCLLQELADLECCLMNDSHLKAELLLNKAPELINYSNNLCKTPIDIAQESLKAAEKNCGPSHIASVEKLIAVFKKYAALTAEQAK